MLAISTVRFPIPSRKLTIYPDTNLLDTLSRAVNHHHKQKEKNK